MRIPMMDQDSSQSTPLTGLQPNKMDRANSRRRRSNSIQTGSDKEDQRSQASATHSDLNSETSRYNRARGPINDAVHSAFDPLDPNHTAIPPEVLSQLTSQITANVLQHLKSAQLSPPIEHQTPNVTDHLDTVSSTGGSPPIDRDKVYTPPSPYRASEEAARSHSPTSPRKQHKFPPPPDVKRPPSPPFSYGALSEDSDAKEGFKSRPKTERTLTGEEMSVCEKIWGGLFDEQGKPTARLSLFLRGIAVHLIEDYEPKHSLVVSPAKMQKYYRDTKVTDEIYPWHVVFDDRTSSISRMFREIEAEHHLVQDRLDDRPDIPGLTPKGFETWMLLVLKAHPDEEFERLAYTAVNMPVSNPDDKTERFPKQLVRRQFPKEADNTVAAKLQRITHTHCGIRIPPRNGSIAERDTRQTTTRSSDTTNHLSSSAPRPPFTDYSLSQSTTRSSVPEIDRNALRPVVSEAAVEDTPSDVLPPPQIERERKPYIAQPGGGKYHDNLDTATIQPADSQTSYSTSHAPPPLTRSASLSGRSTDPKVRPPQPIAIHQKNSQGPPPPEMSPQMRPRTGSSYHRDPPKRGDRNRSPSNSRNNEGPQKSDEGVNYGLYHTSSSGDYSSGSRQSDNRYNNRASFSVDQRDREPRQRYHSMSTADNHRYYPNKDYPNDEEYYRSGNNGYIGMDAQYPHSQYPPTSYRGRAQ